MAEPQTLPAMVRAKFPGVYDDLSDIELDAKVRAKYPGTYDDLPSPSVQAPEAHLSASLPNTATALDPLVFGKGTKANESQIGEFIHKLADDPKGAMTQVAAELGRDATNPKVWLSLSAAYFAPKVFQAAAPVIAKAIKGATGLVSSEAAKDVAMVVGGEGRVSAGLRLVDRLKRAAPVEAPPPQPAAEPPAAPPQAAQVAPAPVAAQAPTPAPVASPAPAQPAAATPAMSPARILNELALSARRAGVKLSQEDYQALIPAVEQGLAPAEAVKNLPALKLLQTSGFQSEAQMTEAIRQRRLRQKS